MPFGRLLHSGLALAIPLNFTLHIVPYHKKHVNTFLAPKSAVNDTKNAVRF